MNRVKFFQFLSLALLLINVLLIGFLIMNRPGPMKGPGERIIRHLELTPNQITTYKASIKNHKIKINEANQQVRMLKQELYEGLGNDMSEEDQALIIEKLSTKKKEIEEIHLLHFREIKALCTPEQQLKFKELSSEIARFFSPGPPKHMKRGR